MRIGLYARVSTDEQAKDGFSIPAQLRTLNAWAVIKGASDIFEYVDDGYSAKNLNRPGVSRLIADCESRKLDVVVVWRLDRLSRNLRDLLVTIEDTFKPNGVEFISATENIDTSTPSGRLMLNILGSVAQNERENTAERVTMVMMDIARQCKHLGGKPVYGLGVAPDKSYYIVEHEAAGLRMAVRMRIEGRSINDIIDAMTENGFLTRSGKPFTKTCLYEIFRNPKIAGYYTYNRLAAAQRSGKRNGHDYKSSDDIICIPGGIPSIITQDEWRELQMANQKGMVTGGHNKAKNIYLVSGLCRCGKCGGPMNIANGGRNRDGSYWRVYRCKDKCVPGIEYKKMDAGVVAYLKQIASDPSILERVIKIAEEYAVMHNEDAQADVEPLRERLRQIEKEKANLVAFVVKSGESAPKSIMDELKQYEIETDAINKRINAIESSRLIINKQQISDNVKKIIDMEASSDADKREIVRQLVSCIIVHEDTVEVQLTIGCGGADALPEAIVKLFTFFVARATIMQSI